MAITEENKKNNIKEAQYYLNVISEVNDSIPKVIPDGFYGNGTRRAVEAFQEYAGLPVTGEIDETTWNAIYAEYRNAEHRLSDLEGIYPFAIRGIELKRNDVNGGYFIYIIQVMLNTIAQFYDNLTPPAINGFFDEATEFAVMELQEIIGEEMTGVIDKSTWQKLAMLYNFHALIEEGEAFADNGEIAEYIAVQGSSHNVG